MASDFNAIDHTIPATAKRMRQTVAPVSLAIWLPRCPGALPRCPEALPRCPEALPRCPEALPRCPEALPRCPEALR